MPDLRTEGNYKMMDSVCLSIRFVRLPVVCLDLIRERKGTDRIEAHQTRNLWTYLEVKGSKVKVTRPINVVTDNAPYAGRGIIFLKLTYYSLY